MRTFDRGARHHVWCHSQAVWLNLSLVARLEDLEGGVAAEQGGLVRYSAMMIGETCATIVALTTLVEGPLPARQMRAAWALACIDGHALEPACRELIAGFPAAAQNAGIQAACNDLVRRTREIVGEVPDALTSDGYFPALAVAREWHYLRDELGQKSFFPEEWARRAGAIQI